MYVEMTNRNGEVRRAFATSIDEAREIALEQGFVKSATHAKVVSVQVVCRKCFPHTGMAVLHVSETPPMFYVWRGDTKTKQNSGKLHNSWRCPA